MANEWPRQLFGKLCEHSAFGPRFSSDEYSKSGNVACLRTMDISANGRIDLPAMPLADLDIRRFKQHFLQSDDLVITRTGAYLGKVAVFEDFRLPVLAGAFLIRFRLRTDLMMPLFARYYLNSPIGQEQIQAIVTGSVQPNLNITNLHTLELPVPPLREQEKVVCFFRSLDDKIELNRRMNETLEAMARALFKSWFIDFDPVHAKAAVRRQHPNWSNAQVSRAALPNLAAEIAELFPDRFEDSALGSVPAGWKTVPLPDAIEVNPTRSLSKGTVAPYLEMSNMPTGSARAVAWENREFGSGMRFVNGDTLVARITPCLENGKTAYVDFLADGQIGSGSTEYIVLRSKAPLPTTFAYFLSRTDDFRSHVVANMTGTSGRQRAPAECLDKYFVVVPDGKLAEGFGGFANRCLAMMKQNDEETAALAASRDALLPKLLLGELVCTHMCQSS